MENTILLIEMKEKEREKPGRSVVRTTKKPHTLARPLLWWWGQDLNLQPSGYEPDELPIAPPHDVNVL